MVAIMDLHNFEQEIRKTGFVLENNIAELLSRNGWRYISNKYYEDDLEGSVREIDLFAYKSNLINHLHVYTILLISCKKSDSNAWALLSRDVGQYSVDLAWLPFHAWSNDKILNHELSREAFTVDYHDAIINSEAANALKISDADVFAFQEMKKETGASQNDKNIFNSVTSLMKSQAYELSVN